MSLPAEWPAALRDFLEQTYGSATTVDMLNNGMSRAGVWRATFATGAAIVKCSPNPCESVFYEHIAPVLRAQSVPIVASYWTGHEAALHWVAIEALPEPLPRDRWEADPAVLAALYHLHTSVLPLDLDLSGLFRPQWTDRMTTDALSLLPAPIAERCAPLWTRIQQRYQHVFAPLCPVSADPNPGNWGVRGDGTVALFDWERFSLGTPAIDLAITLKGLPDITRCANIAAAYTHIDGVATNLDAFACDIAAAKLWSIVEFMEGFANNRHDAAATVAYLVENVPQWVESLGL